VPVWAGSVPNRTIGNQVSNTVPSEAMVASLTTVVAPVMYVSLIRSIEERL
jgi:hypothetical protein